MIFKKKKTCTRGGGRRPPLYILLRIFYIYAKKIPYILYILEDMLFYIYIYYLLFPDHMALPTLELIWQFERETNKKKAKHFFYGKKEKKL